MPEITATVPPSANSPTMHSRLVHQERAPKSKTPQSQLFWRYLCDLKRNVLSFVILSLRSLTRSFQSTLFFIVNGGVHKHNWIGLRADSVKILFKEALQDYASVGRSTEQENLNVVLYLLIFFCNGIFQATLTKIIIDFHENLPPNRANLKKGKFSWFC